MDDKQESERTASFDLEIQSLRETLRATGHDLDVASNPAAPDARITACETAIGMVLPESFRAVLREHDGLSMTVDREPGLSHQLIVYSTDQIVEKHQCFERFYADVGRDGMPVESHDLAGTTARFWDDLIAFASYGDGMCLFDVRPAAGDAFVVLDLDVEDLRMTREHVIAESFDDWLSKIFASATERHSFVYWLPEEDDDPFPAGG